MLSRSIKDQEFSEKKHSNPDVQLLRSIYSSSDLMDPDFKSSFTHSRCNSGNSICNSDVDDQVVLCGQWESDVKFDSSSKEHKQHQRHDQPTKEAAFKGYKIPLERSVELATKSLIPRASILSATTVVTEGYKSSSLQCVVGHAHIVSHLPSNGKAPYNTRGDPNTIVTNNQYDVPSPGLPPKTTRWTGARLKLPECLQHLNIQLQRQDSTPGDFKIQHCHAFNRIEERENPSLHSQTILSRDSERSPIETYPCSDINSGLSVQQLPPLLPPTHQNNTEQDASHIASPRQALLETLEPPLNQVYENRYENPQPPLPRCQNQKSNQHCCLQRRFLLPITSVSIIIAAYSVGILIFHLMTAPIPSTGYDQDSCIPCDTLPVTQGDENIKKLTKKRDSGSGEEKCCFDSTNSSQTTALVGLLIDKRHQTETGMPKFTYNSSEIPTDLKTVFPFVSAHKNLLLPNDYATSPCMLPFKMLFNTKLDPITEYLRGVLITRHHLIIMYSGLYFVHSSVTFKVDRPKDNSCTFKILNYDITHQGARSSRGTKLTSGVGQVCEDCFFRIFTSYTGGMFYLKTGDKLSIEVTRSGLVVDPESSFLGLTMIFSRAV